MIKVLRKLKKISCEVRVHLNFIMHVQKAIEPIMQQPINNNTVMPLTPAVATSTTTTPLGLGLGPSSNKMSRALYAHKLRTHTNKLKQQTNKIISIRPILSIENMSNSTLGCRPEISDQ